MMRRIGPGEGDFEAVVRILSAREGGRASPPFQGIRWDLRYFSDDGVAWMVWPEFLDEAGDPLPPDRPITGLVRARFLVVDPRMRPFHRERVRPGEGFFCVEGAKVCAAGVITRVTGLERDEP